MPKTQVTRPKTRTDQLNKSMAISWLDVSYTATTYLATTTTTKSSVHCPHFCGVRARVCGVWEPSHEHQYDEEEDAGRSCAEEFTQAP